MIETVIVNDELPQSLVDEYRAANSTPVMLDISRLNRLGINVELKRLIEENPRYVRHSSLKLARIIYTWFRKNSQNKGEKHVQKSNI